MKVFDLTLEELIEEALEEARIMECAMDEFDEDHMLLTAMKLSGAPYSFVEKVYHDNVSRKVRQYA